MTHFAVKALDAATWPDFARLVEAHDGVWGGCWCMGFHHEGFGEEQSSARNRANKEARVLAGTAYAALVFDGDDCVGWCQFGPPSDLSRIKYKKAYGEGTGTPPDWRITCFFVARPHRRQGVADVALGGALTLIAGLGGGRVESSPEAVECGRKTSGSFLFNATLSIFEAHGFERVRPIGKHAWLVTATVRPSAMSPH